MTKGRKNPLRYEFKNHVQTNGGAGTSAGHMYKNTNRQILMSFYKSQVQVDLKSPHKTR